MVFRALLDLLFPVHCLLCHAPNRWACPEHLFFGGVVEEILLDGLHVYALGSYADPFLQQLVKGLKFQGYRECGVLLGQLLALRVRDVLTISEAERAVLVPLPLSRWRENQRGYNQAELIARAVSLETGIPVFPHALARRHRRPQSGLAPSGRAQNIHAAFSVRDPNVFEGRVVLLVDDVATTGSTLLACRDAILATCKPSRVIAFTAAHG